ncbi:ubiquitin domain-containing protein 7SL RNA1-like [Lotus japonicus]|uniref:ubiquitin domain-containing protein 7SL RNA1-like n=1 Tax=Lotus japonicus TaxID=34305 RepID=UPI00258993A9|nr:ubiquitin domain-containing protein 7SL RNA1-like [Lotus japonicus]
MDVIFVVPRGKPFSIEVGYFDTVIEIKEKVQKYQGIPISRQTLIFKGQVLPDDGDVWKCEILHKSRIQLLVTPESDKKPVKVKTEEFSSPTKIQKLAKVKTEELHVSYEMDVNDTVLKLKDKIHDIEHVSKNNLVLHKAGTELHDHQFLRDCDVSDNSEIDVSVRASSAMVPTTSAATGTGVGGGGGESKKLKLKILPQSGTEKIPIEVNASDNVGELRKELQKLQQRLQFDLPQSYFFIHKQDVMYDDRSFRWHQVGQGDTIEIFSGSVTG